MRWVLMLLLLAVSTVAQAHKPSDSYLIFKSEPGHVTGQWDIALRDLEYAIGLDADGNGEITWGELSARHRDLAVGRARLGLGLEEPVGGRIVDQQAEG